MEENFDLFLYGESVDDILSRQPPRKRPRLDDSLTAPINTIQSENPHVGSTNALPNRTANQSPSPSHSLASNFSASSPQPSTASLYSWSRRPYARTSLDPSPAPAFESTISATLDSIMEKEASNSINTKEPRLQSNQGNLFRAPIPENQLIAAPNDQPCFISQASDMTFLNKETRLLSDQSLSPHQKEDPPILATSVRLYGPTSSSVATTAVHVSAVSRTPNPAQESLSRHPAIPFESLIAPASSSNTFKPEFSSNMKEVSPMTSNNHADDDFCSSQASENVCSICFEAWNQSGLHRVVSLACGHLFGAKCIEKWIRQAGRCPICQKGAKMKDLRPVFVARVRVMDNEEKYLKSISNKQAKYESLLEAERSERAVSDAKIQTLSIKYRSLEREYLQLRQTYQALRDSINENGISNSRATEIEHQNIIKSNDSDRSTGSINPGAVSDQSKTTNISEAEFINQIQRLEERRIAAQNSCEFQNPMTVKHTYTHRLPGARVIARSPSAPAIYVSSILGQGKCGLSRIDITRPSSGFNILLHSKEIRDIQCSPGREIALTIYDFRSGGPSLRYESNYPLWSCAFAGSDSSRLLAGASTGHLLTLDIRRPSELLCSPPRISRTPIHSISHTQSPPSHQSILRRTNSRFESLNSRSSVLIGSLSGLHLFHADHPSDAHLLQEAPFTHVEYNPEHCVLLASKRTGQPLGNAASVYEWKFNSDFTPPTNLNCDIPLHPKFTRPHIIRYHSNSIILGTSAEPATSFCAWDAYRGVKLMSIVESNPAYDSCICEWNSSATLATVSKDTVNLYSLSTHSDDSSSCTLI